MASQMGGGGAERRTTFPNLSGTYALSLGVTWKSYFKKSSSHPPSFRSAATLMVPRVMAEQLADSPNGSVVALAVSTEKKLRSRGLLTKGKLKALPLPKIL